MDGLSASLGSSFLSDAGVDFGCWLLKVRVVDVCLWILVGMLVDEWMVFHVWGQLVVNNILKDGIDI